MTLLILGVLIWAYSHLMKRVTPGFRAGLGDRTGKLVATALSFVALYLMVVGYRGADVIVLWEPPAFFRHINNLLMLVAVVLVSMQANRGRMRTWMRHPMLASVKTWSLAHLMVNGDLASVILFGGIFAWALTDLILINRAEPNWTRPEAGPAKNDLIHLAGALVAVAAIGWVHAWLGYPVFG